MRDFPLDLFLNGGSQPAGIHEYFEDLNRTPNAEFGSKDFFEIGSNEISGIPCNQIEMPGKVACYPARSPDFSIILSVTIRR